jgi:hypothetical protein
MQPAQIISTRTSVRDHDGLRAGLGGGSCIHTLPRAFRTGMQGPAAIDPLVFHEK